jgi:hypothetical protein
VASLQEQAGADVVLKTLGTGLHPRRSKSLATFCSPVIAACSFRDALMLTGNVTDDDASRRQTAPCCGSPSPMPSRDRRRTKSSSPSAKVPFASGRGCTAGQHRSTAIVEEAIARLSPFVRYHLNSTSTADIGSGCVDLWRAGGCDSRGLSGDGLGGTLRQRPEDKRAADEARLLALDPAPRARDRGHLDTSAHLASRLGESTGARRSYQSSSRLRLSCVSDWVIGRGKRVERVS